MARAHIGGGMIEAVQLFFTDAEFFMRVLGGAIPVLFITILLGLGAWAMWFIGHSE